MIMDLTPCHWCIQTLIAKHGSIEWLWKFLAQSVSRSGVWRLRWLSKSELIGFCDEQWVLFLRIVWIVGKNFFDLIFGDGLAEFGGGRFTVKWLCKYGVFSPFVHWCGRFLSKYCRQSIVRVWTAFTESIWLSGHEKRKITRGSVCIWFLWMRMFMEGSFLIHWMKRQAIAFVACNHERVHAFARGLEAASFARHWWFHPKLGSMHK